MPFINDERLSLPYQCVCHLFLLPILWIEYKLQCNVKENERSEPIFFYFCKNIAI